jgi:hypothetical protein
MNKPLILIRNVDGSPLLDSNGNKQYNQDTTISKFPNRKVRRNYMQKSTRNPLYGISLTSKYIQIVPEVIKTPEGIVEKLGRILTKGKRGYDWTGKVKAIDHYPYKTR